MKMLPMHLMRWYAASLPNVILVLSGMSDLKQLQDNTAYMKDFQPLTDKEQQAIGKVVEELEKLPTIPCTNCRYCVEGCPKKIRIPDIFGVYNMGVQFGVTDVTRGLTAVRSTEAVKPETASNAENARHSARSILKSENC